MSRLKTIYSGWKRDFTEMSLIYVIFYSKEIRIENIISIPMFHKLIYEHDVKWINMQFNGPNYQWRLKYTLSNTVNKVYIVHLEISYRNCNRFYCSYLILHRNNAFAQSIAAGSTLPHQCHFFWLTLEWFTLFLNNTQFCLIYYTIPNHRCLLWL